MTPDEQVRAIHRLEGAVRFLGDEQESLKTRLALLEGRMKVVSQHGMTLSLLDRRLSALLTQQNALLAAIRGLAPAGETVAQG